MLWKGQKRAPSKGQERAVVSISGLFFFHLRDKKFLPADVYRKKSILLALWTPVIFLFSRSGIASQEITTVAAFSLPVQGAAGGNPLNTHILAVQKTQGLAGCFPPSELRGRSQWQKGRAQAPAQPSCCGTAGCPGRIWPAPSQCPDFKVGPRSMHFLGLIQ